MSLDAGQLLEHKGDFGVIIEICLRLSKVNFASDSGRLKNSDKASTKKYG